MILNCMTMPTNPTFNLNSALLAIERKGSVEQSFTSFARGVIFKFVHAEGKSLFTNLHTDSA